MGVLFFFVQISLLITKKRKKRTPTFLVEKFMGVLFFFVQISLLITKTSVVVHNERPEPDFSSRYPRANWEISGR